MNIKITTYLAILTSMVGFNAYALTGVSPSGLNVRTTGPTSAFITFQGTEGQTSTDAFWCGAVSAPPGTVTDFNPCVVGTECGRLPARHNLSRPSGTGGASNFTDIMTIPSSISRCAFQDARSGSNSAFFYIRRFVDAAGNEQYTSVTCRLAGGGARSPLSLTNVDVYFKATKGNRPVYLFSRGELSPAIEAEIHYNGSGQLKGRWEVVKPGDSEPSRDDLLTEASLPIELRGLQKRYTMLNRISIFLPPTGKAFIPGPKPELIPTDLEGPYKILLRIEASKDKEGDSNTTTGIVHSGGVAGFPMPVLRYYVGSAEEVAKTKQRLLTGKLTLFLPQAGARFRKGQSLNFSWADIAKGSKYILEVRSESEIVLSAVINSGVSSYSAPPWLVEEAGDTLQWRVKALDKGGDAMAQSQWRELVVEVE